MPDKIFKEFLNFKEMSEKNDYLNSYKIKSANIPELFKDIKSIEARIHTLDSETEAVEISLLNETLDEVKKRVVSAYREIMLSIAVFSAYGEGMHLFSSFAMLLNSVRGGNFVGMGDVLRWSIQDEIMHYMGMLDVYKVLFQELAELGYVEDIESFISSLETDVKKIAVEMVALEDAFIDLCFSTFSHDSLTKEEMKEYTRYLCDRRTISLGFDPIYGIKNSPIEWIDAIINAVEHANFFETKSAGYQRMLIHSPEEVVDEVLANFKK
jgi:ribonucleoside-diphosphate reductase beta chain